MTYKDILINFIIYKNAIIHLHVFIKKHKNEYCKLCSKTVKESNYIIGDDLKEIENNWSESDCRDILKKLSISFESDFCPWCIRARTLSYGCDKCSYGHRHGICGNSIDNTYSFIIWCINKETRTTMLNLSGIKLLYIKTKLKFYFKRILDIYKNMKRGINGFKRFNKRIWHRFQKR